MLGMEILVDLIQHHHHVGASCVEVDNIKRSRVDGVSGLKAQSHGGCVFANKVGHVAATH